MIVFNSEYLKERINMQGKELQQAHVDTLQSLVWYLDKIYRELRAYTEDRMDHALAQAKLIAAQLTDSRFEEHH
jgi:hypothetical protein